MQLDLVEGEYAEYIEAKWPKIVAAISAFSLAYSTSVFLAATLTPIGELLAVLIQLLLLGKMAQAIQSELDTAGEYARLWWTTAYNAGGDRKAIEAAGNALVQTLIHLLMGLPGVVGRVPLPARVGSPIVINPTSQSVDPSLGAFGVPKQLSTGAPSTPARGQVSTNVGQPSLVPSLQLGRIGTVAANSSVAGVEGSSHSDSRDPLTRDLEKAIAHLRKHLSVDDAEVLTNYWREAVDGGHDTVQDVLRNTDASAYLRSKIPKYIRLLKQRVLAGRRGLQRPSLSKSNVPESDLVEDAAGRRSSLSVAVKTLDDAYECKSTGVLSLERYLVLFDNFHKSFGYRPLVAGIETAHFDDGWLAPFRFIVVVDYEPSFEEFNVISAVSHGYVTETAPDVISSFDDRPGENMMDEKNHDLTHLRITSPLTRNAARYFARMSERIDFVDAFCRELEGKSGFQRKLHHLMFFEAWHETGDEAHPVSMYRRVSPDKAADKLFKNLALYAQPTKGYLADVHYTNITRDDILREAVDFVRFVRLYVESSSNHRKLAKFNDELERRFPEYFFNSGSTTPEGLMEELADNTSIVKRRRLSSISNDVQNRLREFAEQHLAEQHLGRAAE